jgi:hypothetical protein
LNYELDPRALSAVSMKKHNVWHVPGRLATSAALVFASVALALIALEIGLRLWDGVPVFAAYNFVGLELDKLHKPGTSGGLDHDPHLGWVHSPNVVMNANFPETRVTTGEYGVRMPSAQVVPLQQRAILMVGDSFGAGGEVADAESWPARLEQTLGTQVINAAVGGYGLDQMVLRAEMLLPLLKPRMLLVQSRLEYGNSVDRMSVAGGTPKPYFTVENGELVLHNQPVPRIASSTHDLGWERSIFGHFYLVHYVMTRFDLLQWWVTSMRIKYELSESEALDVGCLLMRRLADIRDRHGIRVALIIQYSALEVAEQSAAWERAHDEVPACARKEGLEIVDTRDAMQKVYDSGDSASYQRLWMMHDNNRVYGHPSAEGTRLIADAVSQKLFAAEASVPQRH